MPNYIINKNSDNNGNNEVHTTTCAHLPLSSNQEQLGWHLNGTYAVAYAKSIGWKNADGCKHCAFEAHNG